MNLPRRGELVSAAGGTPVARFLSSLRLSVACLAALFVLVLAGTLHEASHGLWEAERLFFRAWLSRIGPIPFPGARSVLWLLTLNLLASLVFRVRWIRTNAGLITAHAGLILLLAGGLVSGLARTEAMLSLREGEEEATAVDPLAWELRLESDAGPAVHSLDSLRPGRALSSPLQGVGLRVERVLENSAAHRDSSGEIDGVAELDRDAERSRNIPSLVLLVETPDGGATRVALWGQDPSRTRIRVADRSFVLWLTRRPYPLPAAVRLESFEAEFHPGTDIPRSFRSSVLLGAEGVSRRAVISMNQPLRFRGYTFYQSSWGADGDGRPVSVLSVVRSPGRLIPYLSALLITAGILAHALMRWETR